jgi:hypothetical protein
MITIRETSRTNVELPEFSLQQLGEIAGVAIAAEESRISQAINVHDQPARPLSLRYAKSKVKAGGQPVRDLHLTGDMLASLRVVDLESNSATVGFADPGQEAKARHNERFENMLGVSPADETQVDSDVRNIFAGNLKRLQQK